MTKTGGGGNTVDDSKGNREEKVRGKKDEWSEKFKSEGGGKNRAGKSEKRNDI